MWTQTIFWRWKSFTLTLPFLFLLGITHEIRAANFSEAETLFHSGKLEEAKEIASAEVDRGIWNRRWSELLIQCQMAEGDYQSALATYDDAVKRYPTSLPLRVLGIQVAHFNDLPDRAAGEKAMIERYLQTGQLRYATADTLIAAGRFFSENGIDARIILKSFFDRVLETDPMNLDALIATAELAISKGDFAVAAETIQKAQARNLVDARLDYLHAMALGSSNPQAAQQALERAIEANPIYEPALVLKAENQIDREDYSGATETIQSIQSVNPKSPSAFALQAVLAHLSGNYDREKELRDKALADWKTNPEVDHLIGRKLSDKYRFAEGAHYQRLALTFEPSHLGATFQLAQDLLRLGDDEIGWKLAEQVNTEDPYNVVAFNLMTLKDRMDGFQTFAASSPQAPLNDLIAQASDEESNTTVPEPGEILIRMDPRERQIYGTAVAELLSNAKRTLTQKYDLKLDRPVIVEIFPRQSDFAIRTFGLPGGEGFLGVCFGHVVTANSPASQGARPSNWKSVLWHEFCHVITLSKTKNRMPRWLSEGISVYEERQRDPRWGQTMTARYREMILGKDFTPVSKLSGAFLAPQSPTHLQFAYYESSLVVEYLVDEFGHEKLNDALDALAAGIPINEALAENIAPIERIERGFTEYARTLAMEFGESIEFERPEFPEDAPSSLRVAWAKKNPNNYWARMMLAQGLFFAKKHAEAVEHLEFLYENGAYAPEQGGVLESLATSYRELGDAEKERKILDQLFQISPDALPSLERFIEMELEQQNWTSALRAAQQALEIQPFSTALHNAVVTTNRELGQSENALGSLLALEAMDPVDVAGIKFQLAESLAAAGDQDIATDHLIDALLTAPRYRDAHALLLKLNSPPSPQPTALKSDTDTELAPKPPTASTESPEESVEKPADESASSTVETQSK